MIKKIKQPARQDDPAKFMFNMLSAMYKPIEKRLIADCIKAGHGEIVTKYNTGSYMLKIAMLDKYAQHLGL